MEFLEITSYPLTQVSTIDKFRHIILCIYVKDLRKMTEKVMQLEVTFLSRLCKIYIREFNRRFLKMIILTPARQILTVFVDLWDPQLLLATI